MSALFLLIVCGVALPFVAVARWVARRRSWLDVAARWMRLDE